MSFSPSLSGWWTKFFKEKSHGSDGGTPYQDSIILLPRRQALRVFFPYLPWLTFPLCMYVHSLYVYVCFARHGLFVAYANWWRAGVAWHRFRVFCFFLSAALLWRELCREMVVKWFSCGSSFDMPMFLMYFYCYTFKCLLDIVLRRTRSVKYLTLQHLYERQFP